MRIMSNNIRTPASGVVEWVIGRQLCLPNAVTHSKEVHSELIVRERKERKDVTDASLIA